MSIQLDHLRYNVPGIMLGVRDDPLTSVQHYSCGLSDIQKDLPMDGQMFIPCGAITRTFTAAILLGLVDTQGIDIDMPLEHLVRTYQADDGLLLLLTGQYPFLKPVTIRELLTHRAGLPAFDRTLAYNKTFLAKPRKKWQIENYFDAISGGDVRYQWGYTRGQRGTPSDSATHYLVAGLIAEALTGIPLSSMMSALFDQYGLAETHYVPYGVISRNLATKMLHGYLPLSHPAAPAFQKQPVLYYNNNKELQVYDVTGLYCLNGMAHGAAVSTTSDLMRWFAALLTEQVVPPTYQSILAHTWTTASMPGRPGMELISVAGHSLGVEVLLAHRVDRARTIILVVNTSRQHLCLEDHDLVTEVLQQCLVR